jgi:Fe2+ or Zn2+ uptake regulation protein
MDAKISTSFRELCGRHGLAVTHQRQVLYEAMQRMHGHPSPEDVYHRVRKRIPSISLATVYKNIHLFVESGILREVSLHHGSLRVERNEHPHHHLICTECKSIADVDAKFFGLAAKPRKLPEGFLVERYVVDILGRCKSCQTQTLKA